VASEVAVNATRAEIRAQRDRIAALMGQIRDLVREGLPDSAQRITPGNTTLRQRVRHLSQENRVLGERLHAARSSSRFADRRIAPEPDRRGCQEAMGQVRVTVIRLRA
jgi:hypothetical protein